MVLKLSMRLKPSPAARLETPKEAKASAPIAVPTGTPPSSKLRVVL
jgi:hypothetical protein